MATITPSLSLMRMQTSEQKAVYDHDHHPFPSQKRENTDGHLQSIPFPEEACQPVSLPASQPASQSASQPSNLSAIQSANHPGPDLGVCWAFCRGRKSPKHDL